MNQNKPEWAKEVGSILADKTGAIPTKGFDAIMDLISQAKKQGMELGESAGYLKGYGKATMESAKKIYQAEKRGREETIKDIKRLNLWSKGNVEGTRNDIIAKLSQLTNINKTTSNVDIEDKDIN